MFCGEKDLRKLQYVGAALSPLTKSENCSMPLSIQKIKSHDTIRILL